jgi:hypothetical protein
MKPGDLFPVNDSDFHYQLPPGLKAGTLVKLIAFDHGFWTVEANGQRFKVFIIRIESGWEYEFKGRWLSADDPRVIAEKKRTSLRSSPAYSAVNGGCVNPPLTV